MIKSLKAKAEKEVEKVNTNDLSLFKKFEVKPSLL